VVARLAVEPCHGGEVEPPPSNQKDLVTVRGCRVVCSSNDIFTSIFIRPLGIVTWLDDNSVGIRGG
jgi:hypothetical protein